MTTDYTEGVETLEEVKTVVRTQVIIGGPKITPRMKRFLENKFQEEKKEYTKWQEESAAAKKRGEESGDTNSTQTLWDEKLLGLQKQTEYQTVQPEIQKEVIALGSKFTALINQKEKEYIIDGVGCQTTKIEIINYSCLVGKRLMGKKVGDEITLGDGKTILKIINIDYPW